MLLVLLERHSALPLPPILLQAAASRLMAWDIPVVDQHVKDAQKRHQEARRVLGLETNSDHDARAETDNRDEHASDGPVALEDKADEEEDEQNATSELEAGHVSWHTQKHGGAMRSGETASLIAQTGCHVFHIEARR